MKSVKGGPSEFRYDLISILTQIKIYTAFLKLLVILF